MWVVYYSEKIISEKWGTTYTREIIEYEGSAEACDKYIKENSTEKRPLYRAWYCI